MGDAQTGGHVFLCYAREDSARVDELESALRGARLPVWRDTTELLPGQDWRIVIGRAIAEEASVLLACFSSRSLARPVGYQNAELALAAEQARLRRAGDPWLIPVRFDDCELPELDLGSGRRLGGIQRADLFGPKADAALGQLVRAIRLILSGTQRAAAAEAEAAADSISALKAMLPAPQDAWRYPEVMKEFVTQVTALAAHLDDAPGLLVDQDLAETFLDLLAWAGWYLNEQSDVDRSVPLLERVLADRERVLGADHPDTLTSRNNLAYAYQSAGRLNEAVSLYQQDLADRERMLGADHPHTLTSRNNLAFAYQSAGRLSEAVSLYQQALAGRERVLGGDHQETLTARNNLASAYESAGMLDHAVALYQQALADSERALGVGHPLTRTIRDNRARARARALAG